MILDQTTSGISALVGVLLLLSTATIILRFVARGMQKNSFGLDDYVTLPAWVCFVGLCILAIYGMVHRFVALQMPKDQQVLAGLLPAFVEIYWIANLLSVFATGFIRLSALLFYRRLFTTPNRWDNFGIITFTGIVTVILWITVFVLLQIFACGKHVDWLFDIKLTSTCIVYPYLESVSISSFLLDSFLLLIPIPKIWLLHTDSVRKLAITVVFLLGAAGTAASCARMIFNIKTLGQGRAVNDADAFLTNTSLLYYILLEAGLGLVTVNLPSLWYFVSGVSTERILRSIRSFASLHSVRSATEYEMEKDSIASNPVRPGATSAMRGISYTTHYGVAE